MLLLAAALLAAPAHAVDLELSVTPPHAEAHTLVLEDLALDQGGQSYVVFEEPGRALRVDPVLSQDGENWTVEFAVYQMQWRGRGGDPWAGRVKQTRLASPRVKVPGDEPFMVSWGTAGCADGKSGDHVMILSGQVRTG